MGLSSVFAATPGKAWAEKFFIAWAFGAWIPAVAIFIYVKAWEWFLAWHYVAFWGTFALGCFLIPLLWPGEPDRAKPLTERYWFKANVWIAILSYVGNYFWTHYFYNLLGASYTVPAHGWYSINRVPWCMFLATHAYFCFYHSFTTVTLRIFWNSSFYRSMKKSGWLLGLAASCVVVGALAVFTAFSETFTIQGFPHYVIKDRTYMYTYGSACYAIYFIVSFPMFYRLDEKKGDAWNVQRVAVDALGACMLVTILLDLWRLTIGGLGANSTFCY